MKKRFLLCGMLLLCLIALCAQAEDVAAEDMPVILQNGDEITLSLNFSGEMAGMQAVVKWDPLCLAMDTVPAYNAAFKLGSMVAMLNPDMENGALNIVYLRQKNLSTEEMEVLTLVFRVLDEAIPCNTEVSIVDCRMTDANAGALDFSCEGFALQIGNPEESSDPDVSAEPTSEPPAGIARLYFKQVLPEPTATPTSAPTATSTPVPTATPAPTATRTPVPTAKPPAGSTGGSVSSGATATPAPTATPTPVPTVTPEPTIPSLVLNGTTPVPGSGSIYIRMRNIAEGFAVDLIAENVTIGGLQANIDYDAAGARLLRRKFSKAFLEGAMVNMINDAVPGRISLVYSNVNGYCGDGSAIFTAEFEANTSVKISLNNVKYTGIGSEISSANVADQNAKWEIQPEDDLEILEEDGIPVVLLKDKYLSLTLNPGEYVSIQLPDREAQDVYWVSERSDVASVSPDGLVSAHSSGLVRLTAMDVNSGLMLGEVRICVRNIDLGLPVEITAVSFDDGMGEAFALTASEGIAEEFAARGIRMCFTDEDRSVIIEGLMPEERVSVPSGAFDFCENLSVVEIIGSNVIGVEERAFSDCKDLVSVSLSEAVTDIHPGAFPVTGDFSLSVFADSPAEMYAIENGMNYNIKEQAGDAE